MEKTNSPQTTISTEALAAGVYYLQLQGNNAILEQKLVIQK